jgi:putative ABC transport system permease protein
MDIPLVRGRTFTDNDDSTANAVIVVSEAMARAYWPGQSALGKRIGWAGNDTTMATVVGVVGDVHFNPNLGGAGSRSEAMPAYYVPMAQAHPWRTMSLVVRTKEDPAAMSRRITRAIASVAPSVAPGSVLTLEHLYASSLAPQRFTSEMMAAFALVALCLAGIGMYGVMSYSVAQRTHDIGVRAALGARPADIMRDVLGAAMRLVATGMLAGIVGAVLMARGLAHLLTQLTRNDPVALAAAIVVLAAAALAGSYVPARRAMRLDPMVALRREA